MQSKLLLFIMLLSAIALVTPHTQDDTHSNEIESDRLGEIRKSVNAMLMDYIKSARLPDDPKTANIQIFSSLIAQESPLSAVIQALYTQTPFSLRDKEITSLHGFQASKDSGKKAEVETAASPLITSYPTKLSKSTGSPPLNRKLSMTLTPTITSIPTANLGETLLYHTASGGTNNSTTFAPIVISTTSVIETIPTAASDSATQNATVASSALTPPPTSNVGTVQPTGVLKVAGALAVGVAGIMIIL